MDSMASLHHKFDTSYEVEKILDERQTVSGGNSGTDECIRAVYTCLHALSMSTRSLSLSLSASICYTRALTYVLVAPGSTTHFASRQARLSLLVASSAAALILIAGRADFSL